jgi:hypothetical protein
MLLKASFLRRLAFSIRKESIESKLRLLSSSRRHQLVSFGLLPTISHIGSYLTVFPLPKEQALQAFAPKRALLRFSYKKRKYKI